MGKPASNIIPSHIAVIMDGNGRWAKSKGLPRSKGHEAGVKSLQEFIKYAGKLGIEYITIYAFSSENWLRPESEVKTLMNLLRKYLKSELKTAQKNEVRYRFIGDLFRLDADIRDLIRDIETLTKDKQGLTLNIALSYGGKDEIVTAARALATEVKEGRLTPDAINEETFASKLLTYPAPYPDLLIRTSGEQRISNFLLWQLAYTEMVFVDTLWPDFSAKDLDFAINEFQNRKRRFGKIED
jgi:undecaprenyl diphosphate synthase